MDEASVADFAVFLDLDEGLEVSELDAAALERWLTTCASACAPAGSGPASWTVRLTRDEEIAELNGRFRGKLGPTDVLSFPGEETPEGRHLGDVVISLPQAAEQAQREDHSLDQEVRILALHGLLHCLGFDHETDDGEMNRIELELRDQLVPGLELNEHLPGAREAVALISWISEPAVEQEPSRRKMSG